MLAECASCVSSCRRAAIGRRSRTDSQLIAIRRSEGSKKAIRAFQARAGLAQDGYPSLEVLDSLRKH